MLCAEEDVCYQHVVPGCRSERDCGQDSQHEGGEVWMFLILISAPGSLFYQLRVLTNAKTSSYFVLKVLFPIIVNLPRL